MYRKNTLKLCGQANKSEIAEFKIRMEKAIKNKKKRILKNKSTCDETELAIQNRNNKITNINNENNRDFSFECLHKNNYLLNNSNPESFDDYVKKIINNFPTKIPKINERNKIGIVAITDNTKYYVDKNIENKKFNELLSIFYGLETININLVEDNIMYRKTIKNETNIFDIKDIHIKLQSYWKKDKTLFGIIGICSTIPMYHFNKNSATHIHNNSSSQTSVSSFSKISVYNKNQENNPFHLTIPICAKLLICQTAHLFGLATCQYYKCVLNEYSFLHSTVAYLCPICLNKLYWVMSYNNIPFDLYERYEKLKIWWKNNHGNRFFQWYTKRIKLINMELNKQTTNN